MRIKRLFDLAAALAGIILLFLPGVIIAFAVKLASSGHVFFTQTRIGRNGRSFTCVKFRTMFIDSAHQGSITTAADVRITPIGRYLRRCKLDELPQLWNVLIGKMSFVGPRPDVPGYADRLSGDDRKILSLRPGITGPASIFFRNEEELLAGQADPKSYNDTVIWPTKVAINRIYIEEWSFWKDIGYILITVIPPLDRIFGLMKRFDGFRETV